MHGVCFLVFAIWFQTTRFYCVHLFLPSGQGAHSGGYLPVSKIRLALLHRGRLWWAHHVQQQRFPPRRPQLQRLPSEMVWFWDSRWEMFEKVIYSFSALWIYMCAFLFIYFHVWIMISHGFLSGDTLYYRFMSDMSNTDWGYKFTVTGGHRGRFQTGTSHFCFLW